MADNFANAGVYIIQTFFGLYTLLIMVRMLMQVARADYYNPICQAIVKITEPAVRPLRPVLPSVMGVDFASLVVAFLVQLAAIMLIMKLYGQPVFSPLYAAWVLIGLFSIIFTIYFFALIIMVIASFIAPYSDHPALTLIHQLVEPVCAPARKLLPPMGGLDFSIILVFVAINVIEIIVINPIAATLQVPRGLILGL
jgi:YggT family protein